MGTKHVVIVGGGFAGIGCAQHLARSNKVHVTLVDQHNYHQFHPFFYQVATAQLATEDVGFSLGRIFLKSPNVEFKVVEVSAVDPKARSVRTKEGPVYQGDFFGACCGVPGKLSKYSWG